MQAIKYQAYIVTPKLPKPIDVEAFVAQSWHDVLSDHAGQSMPITQEVDILTWNIMTLGRGKNNAYRKNEDPDSDYKPRLAKIAGALADAIKSNAKLAVITLQETPNNKEHKNYFFNILTQQLPDTWIVNSQFFAKSNGSNFGTFFLFDNQKVAQPPVVKALSTLNFQQGRALAVEFIFNADTDNPITIVNGHFRYENEKKERLSVDQTQQEINNIFQSFQGQVILAADLNQSTKSIAPYFCNRCFYALGMTSLSHAPHKEELVEQNIDAFIFKYEPVMS